MATTLTPTGNVTHSLRAELAKIEHFRQRVYLLINTVALVTIPLYLLTGELDIVLGQLVNRAIVIPSGLIMFACLATLWRKPETLVVVEKVLFATAATTLLLAPAAKLYLSEDTALHAKAILDIAIWSPLIYVWAYLAWGPRRGLLISVVYFSVDSTLKFAFLWSEWQLSGEPALFTNLLRFGLAGASFIAILYAFAWIVERHVQAHTTAETLAELAYLDTLTGLPNRRLLEERLAHAIAHAQRYERTFALLFIDMDGFKHINDSYGHEGGDKLLRQMAERLNACMRESDTVARVAGDEFAVLVAEIGSVQHLHQVVQKILGTFQDPYLLGEHRVRMSSSIGVSLYPSDGLTAAELLRKADNAMYQAKLLGKNRYQLYQRFWDS